LSISSPDFVGLRTHGSHILAHDKVREAATHSTPPSVIVNLFNYQPVPINTPIPDFMLCIFVKAREDYYVLARDVRREVSTEEVKPVIEELVR